MPREVAFVEVLGIDQLARLLEATPAALLAEADALGPVARWRPAPGEWFVNEVVGHLIEAERRGFCGRIREILAADRPVLETWDPPAVAIARHDDERDPAELLAEFLTLRAESLELVSSLRPGDLARVGRHPVVGDLTVGEILGGWVHHDRNHLAQALAVGQARVWPQMGAAQRFSRSAD